MKINNVAELNLYANQLKILKNYNELNQLADQWLIPHTQVQDFLKNSRYFFADDIDRNSYNSANEKLRTEMFRLNDKGLTDIVALKLINHCDHDEKFAALVQQQHKALSKCINFVFHRAYESVAKDQKIDRKVKTPGQTADPICVPIIGEQVIDWAIEYYRLDDAEDEKKKREEEMLRLKNAREYKPATRSTKKSTKKNTSTTVVKQGSEKAEEEKKPEPKQIELFDFLISQEDTQNDSV